jgi:hypothetical protein
MSRHEARQKLAREFGATDIVTERGDEGVAARELTGGLGTHSAAGAGGNQESMIQAIRSARPGGHVGYVGVAQAPSCPARSYPRTILASPSLMGPSSHPGPSGPGAAGRRSAVKNVGNTRRVLRLVANAWRLYRQAVLPPALPRRAVLLALISDADWVRDESGAQGPGRLGR